MIVLKNVSKYYKANRKITVGLRNVNLEFKLGEFVVITGESGSGKSTLLNVISGLDEYEEGELYLFNKETSHYTLNEWEDYRSAHIGFIFQNYNIIESYTVYQNILLALELQGYPKEKQMNRALELIEMVGLSHRTHQKTSKLSGGEKQRTVIARAIAKDCPVIVADEPTGNLDSESSEMTLKLLHQISKEKLVILVTHNFQDAKPYATRHVRMRDGEIIEDRPLKTTENIEAKEIIKKRRMPNFKTLINSSFRNMFSTPKRFIFQLTLQILIISVFIFIYAFIMYSEDIIIGEGVAERDSSHQIRLVRRDEDIIQIEQFQNLDVIRTIGIYETAYEVYTAFGFPGSRRRNENYPVGEIRIDDVSVLNPIDLTQGNFPNENEVVVSDLFMEIYNLQIGDQLIFQGTYYQYIPTYGTIYTVSGSTIRGNSRSVYFHPSIFTSKEIALEGMMEVTKRRSFYYHYNKDGDLVRNSFSALKFIFDPSLRPGEIHIPSHILPDPMEVTIEDYLFEFGPYFGHTESLFVNPFQVTRTELTNEVIIMSTSYQEHMIDIFFGEHYEPRSVVLNVHDITDGKMLSSMIDHHEYRVFYHIFSATSRERIVTQSEFESIAFFIVASVGFALYTVLGVVVKNISLARKKDFTIFRSIGASKTYLARQVILEQVISGIIAFIITVVLLQIIAIYNHTLSQSMRHLFLYQYFVLFLISVILSIFVARTYNKKYFKFSVIAALNNSEEAKA
jgi:putative ABC transport system permease protein